MSSPVLRPPLLNSGPIFVLKPDRIRSSSPISEILKQPKYSIEKPQKFQNSLHFGPPVIGSHTIISPQLMVPPMGLLPFTSTNLYTKTYPKNSRILSNFQNVLTKFSLNDIFSLKTSPKRKRQWFVDHIQQTISQRLDRQIPFQQKHQTHLKNKSSDYHWKSVPLEQTFRYEYTKQLSFGFKKNRFSEWKNDWIKWTENRTKI